ncbi:glycoside hydrolase family 38 N-terminal domain-containing protein [Cohnella rhizosphaerae]|uniref:Glycoside hydrolase family 38 N-terminal domain-containing protein n=1 Tax=Cohnella rhizosphaerae TaxID=1457232 RepID=A0A9X4QTA6_9BACL|nr:hypothetical protein [Cohnella rhizosphaerae]MDG0810475.1 hypothetical protein [Cohnella rhizosphaerae]
MTLQQQSKQLGKVYVVSHTHWDREWYQDFQSFRTRLVYMMDELLDRLREDAAYRHFMLDGQTIMIEDYLQIRPERKEELLKHLREGRLAAGPWYVMPDEFLVSGESLVRNLLTGFRQSRKLGFEPMKSGYVNDIFGHNSQMPQIFQGFGIDNAVLFRGFYGNGGSRGNVVGRRRRQPIAWSEAGRRPVLQRFLLLPALAVSRSGVPVRGARAGRTRRGDARLQSQTRDDGHRAQSRRLRPYRDRAESGLDAGPVKRQDPGRGVGA